MDPIHPIVPVPPRIPSVSPAPLIGRTDRDSARQQAEEEKRRRRRASGARPDGPLRHAGNAGQDDAGTHVDVTA
jgi:hypothetical protein